MSNMIPTSRQNILDSIKDSVAHAYHNNWRHKNWQNFCKQVMETDKRFHLVPIKDWYKRSYSDEQHGTVFGPFILQMEGDYCPIDVAFAENVQGIRIETGCVYLKAGIAGYHSKSLIWPVIRLCDELNRQYTRMVERAITVQKINTKVSVRPKGTYKKRRSTSN